MERLREWWDDWWKVLGILALIALAGWMVMDCYRGQRDEFLACVADRLPPSYDALYDMSGSGEPQAYYDLIDRYEAMDVAETCYDDTRGVGGGDGEPLERP